VIISYLVPDEDEPAADALVWEAIAGTARLVAPAFVWAEVGSVLYKLFRVLAKCVYYKKSEYN
jgi:hypothetical protein